jgi:hypothetical protein
MRKTRTCSVDRKSCSTLGEGWGEGPSTMLRTGHPYRASKTLTPRPLPEYRERGKPFGTTESITHPDRIAEDPGIAMIRRST